MFRIFQGRIFLSALALISLHCTVLNANICDRTPALVVQIELHVNKLCKDITSDDLKTIGQLGFKNIALESLREGDFAGLSELRYLGFTQSTPKEVSIPANVFSSLNKVEYLSFSNQTIKGIEPKAFLGLSNLKFLSMTVNIESVMGGDDFEGLEKISQLHIRGVGANTFPENFFAKFSSLWMLEISKSSISTITPNQFRGLTNLSTLVISGCNDLVALSKGAFQDLENLYNVVLVENSISELGDELFADNKNLNHIDLSKNKLATIAPEVFSNVNLEEVLEVRIGCNPIANNAVAVEGLKYVLGARLNTEKCEWNIE